MSTRRRRGRRLKAEVSGTEADAGSESGGDNVEVDIEKLLAETAGPSAELKLAEPVAEIVEPKPAEPEPTEPVAELTADILGLEEPPAPTAHKHLPDPEEKKVIVELFCDNEERKNRVSVIATVTGITSIDLPNFTSSVPESRYTSNAQTIRNLQHKCKFLYVPPELVMPCDGLLRVHKIPTGLQLALTVNTNFDVTPKSVSSLLIDFINRQGGSCTVKSSEKI